MCLALALRPKLTSKTVEGLSLALEAVNDVHGGDSLSAGVLGVGDRITDNVLQKDLQNTTGFLINQSGNTLHTTTTSQTANGGLRNSLDVITQYLAVTLGAALSQTFSAFTTTFS